MSYSKYHTAADVPYPGADAVTLAVGMPDHAPPPHKDYGLMGVLHARRACIDCRYCTDMGAGPKPLEFLCSSPMLSFAHRPSLCHEVRDYGCRGHWFKDALSNDSIVSGGGGYDPA